MQSHGEAVTHISCSPDASLRPQMFGSVLVGFFFYYRSWLSAHGWVVLLGSLVIFFTYGLGIAPVTWLLFSELTASAVRSVSLNILLVCFAVMMFRWVRWSRYAVCDSGVLVSGLVSVR